jgi:hypothetical protein
MKIVMVVESMFGNTRMLADAVAQGLRDLDAEVVLLRPDEAGPAARLDRLDLLVLGAPTHALGLSRPSTRADAVSRGADTARATSGVREWLAVLADAPSISDRTPVAVFDTRTSSARHWPGSASGTLNRMLRARGFTVLDRTSFYVQGIQGPILEGEVGRARAWGQWLAGSVRRAGPAARI